MLKIGIALNWSPEWIQKNSLVTLFNATRPAGLWTQMFQPGGGLDVCRVRADTTIQALEWGADYVLYVDADQTYPPDIFERLYHHGMNGEDLVAAPVAIRSGPNRGLANCFRMIEVTDDHDNTPKGRMAPVGACGCEPVEADCCGTGCLMVKADLLRRMEKPWFDLRRLDLETMRYTTTEDIPFTWRMRKELGAKIIVDPLIKVDHWESVKLDRPLSRKSYEPSC